MKLSTVTLSELSGLTHEVKLPETPPFQTPAFKVISYHGEYRHGSGGRADALYIVATATAAHKAWYTEGIVIDFSGLKYEWGDEMEWVFDIGQDRPSSAKCRFPLAILVGDRCKKALQSLVPEEYPDYCVESLEDALRFLRRKRQAYDKCLAEWRSGPPLG